MRPLRIPKAPGAINYLLDTGKPAGGKHRAAGRKLSSRKGSHRAQPPTAVPPWSERDDYFGRHRKSDPPKSKGRGRGLGMFPGRRITPADDRDPGYFTRR